MVLYGINSYIEMTLYGINSYIEMTLHGINSYIEMALHGINSYIEMALHGGQTTNIRCFRGEYTICVCNVYSPRTQAEVNILITHTKVIKLYIHCLKHQIFGLFYI